MTKPFSLILAGLTLAAGLCVGCDTEASRSAKTAAALEEAIATFDRAERGFAATAEGDYQQFRLAHFDEARAKLEAIVAEGDSASKISAHRVLASIDTAMAQVHADRAASAFAVIRGRSTGLFNHLAAVERINALMVARADDGGAVLGALDEGDAMIRESKAGLTSSLAELNAQREAAIVEAERHNAEAARHFETARQLEEQAILAQRIDAKQAGYNQAYAAQLQGEDARLKAQRQQIEADRLAQEIAPLQAELELWDQMATRIGELRERARQDGEESATDVSTALDAKVIAIAAVDEQYQALANLYREDVDKPLTAAIADASDAVQHLDQALGLARGGDRSALQLERAAADVARVHILTRHAGYARGFAAMLGAMAGNPALADAAVLERLREQQQQLARQADQLAEQARATITAGLEGIAAEDADPNDPAQALAAALRSYGEQLN